MTRRTAALIAAVSLAVPDAVAAQTAEPTTGGFLFVYGPRDRPEFDEGYRRHLEWHRSKGDSLSWFGWDVLVGERPGLFVDGVFGVPFAALDVRVDPAGDQADAAVNVLAYAEPLAREMLALRSDLSTATPLERNAPSPIVQVVRYAVAPDAVERIEAVLTALRAQAGARSLLPYTIYERVAGSAPGVVLMVWRDRIGTFDDHARNPVRAFARMLGAAHEEDVGSLVRAVTSEVWVYRRDLTYLGREGSGGQR
jgi:hypothetical protein